MTPSVGAVVVHHRRFPEVLGTVDGVVTAGVPAEAVLVVDNSEDPATAEALRAAARGWRVHVMPNRGYGAAANAGVSMLPDHDVVLVLTHESLVDARSLAALVGALAADPAVAAAGPGLLLTDGGRVWSRGGTLTPRLRLPRHLLATDPGSGPVRDVDWLDGACVAYRRSALAEHPFREDFFLYVEETELHTRLRGAGMRVVAVDAATAVQSTAGMPAYWGCRNTVLFQRTHGTAFSRRAAPLYFTARTMAVALRTRQWHELRQALHGLAAGYRTTTVDEAEVPIS